MERLLRMQLIVQLNAPGMPKVLPVKSGEGEVGGGMWEEYTPQLLLDLEAANKQIPKRSDSRYTRNSGRGILVYLLIIYKLLFLQTKIEATMCVF